VTLSANARFFGLCLTLLYLVALPGQSAWAATSGDGPPSAESSAPVSSEGAAAVSEQSATEAAPQEASAGPSYTGASPVSVKRDPIRLEPSRPSLPTLAFKPGWSDLSQSQRQVLASFESQWQQLPLNEKRAWADLASRFPQMSEQDQARVQRRISEWAKLSPEERKLARANFRMAQQTGSANLQADWERYQAMTPEQRAVLGTAGSTSNTAARHAGAPTGLAKEAAQPLPRRTPKTVIASEPDGQAVPAKGVSQTVGAPANRR
jgi:hypothetical protein